MSLYLIQEWGQQGVESRGDDCFVRARASTSAVESVLSGPAPLSLKFHLDYASVDFDILFPIPSIYKSTSTSVVMAFVLRRPMAITACLKQLPKATQTTARAFHSSPKPSASTSKTVTPITAFAKSRNAFQQSFRRSYMQPGQIAPPDTGSAAQKLLVGAALIGGTLIATNVMFNRETREDGGMPPYERAYLNETFMHTGLGVGIIGVAASALHRSGWSYRLMTTNPWVVMGVGLAASIGTMYGTFATSPDK